jgi:osmotically-inducible protein OsmY
MRRMDLEYQYLVAQLQEALACDPRVGTQDIRVVVQGGRIHLLGDVVSDARRAAVDVVVQEVLPGVPVRNEVRVLPLGDALAPEEIQ